MKLALDITIPEDEVLGKLYEGLAECHSLNSDPRNYIAALKEQYKYLPANRIMYSIGVTYQDRLEDYKNAKIYLERFLKNKPENLSEDSFEEKEDGSLVIGESAYYRAAEQRIKTINEKQFWEGNK